MEPPLPAQIVGYLICVAPGDSLTAISIACAEDIVLTASDLFAANHAGADRLLRTEPQVHFMTNSC